jgi:hypothetical protein
MATDEFFSWHERLTQPSARLLLSLGWEPGHLGPLAFAWVVPGLLIVLVTGVAFRGFLIGLFPATRSRFLIAAIVYLSGVLVMEMVGGWYHESIGKIDRWYMALAQLEEVLEMTGIVLFIRALLLEIQRRDGIGSAGSLPVADC